jgi:4-aminobutyrate aminotransferase-like enzyme
VPRLAPPLVITETEVDDALAILQEALSTVEATARF